MKPTRDEILNEPAGPRLDAWVAIHVMGLKIVGEAPCGNFDGGEMVFLGIDDDGLGLSRRPVYQSFDNWEPFEKDDHNKLNGVPGFALSPVPYYSTDIAAAWQVVEKMGCGTIGHYPRGLWTAYFITQEDGILRHIAQAETAPLAICQAALMAVAG